MQKLTRVLLFLYFRPTSSPLLHWVIADKVYTNVQDKCFYCNEAFALLFGTIPPNTAH